MYHVLNSRIFVKERIQPRHWILKQLLRASETAKVHWALPELLTSYADFCISPKGTSLSGNERPPRFDEQQLYTEPLERIPEESISAALDAALGSDGNSVAQVLLVFYVLTFNQAADVERAVQAKARGDGKSTSPPPYSETFTRALPVKRLMSVAENNPKVFEDVFPTYLALALDAYPELFHTLHSPALTALHGTDTVDTFGDILLVKELAYPLADILTGNGMAMETSLTSKQCVALCSPVDAPVEAFATIQELGRLSDTDLLPFMDMLLESVLGSGGLGHPTAPQLDVRVQDSFLQLWHRLSSVAPQALWTATLWRLQAADGTSGSRRRATVDDLLEDPLELLRIGQRVLQQPMVLEMVVHMLCSCLVGAERRLDQKFVNARAAVSAGDELHTFVHDPGMLASMVLALYSAAVQILLELCLAAEAPSVTTTIRATPPDAATGELQEVRIKVCHFVHQLFIDKPELARLVHCQGYVALPVDASVRASRIPCLCLFETARAAPAPPPRLAQCARRRCSRLSPVGCLDIRPS